MSEYALRHQDDWGKPTDLEIFQHCLPTEASEDMGEMYPDQMAALVQESLAVPVRLPTGLGFNDLKWNAVRWPRNEATLMFGTSPNDREAPALDKALGTIVVWNGALHVAGIQREADAPGRVIAGRYTPETDFNFDTHFPLFRGDIVLSQDELALDDAALAKAAQKQYMYLAYGDNIVERRFVNPAPSHFDGKTERPFDTAGLITPQMVATSWEESALDPETRAVAFTYYHQDWHIPGFAQSWARRNQILAATPHVAPLEGDAHRIVVNGVAYELPTSLPTV